MKEIMKPKYFVAVTSVMLCIIIGLLAFVYWTFRQDDYIKDSLDMLYRTEIDSAARSLAGALDENNATLAYYHAKTAAENAARAGLGDAARMFTDISTSLLESGGVSDEMKNALGMFLESGHAPDTAFSEPQTLSGGAQQYTESSVMQRMYSPAQVKADGILSSEKKLKMCDFKRNEAIVFSCENGYVVIDNEQTPIEANMSLAHTGVALSADRCVEISQEFLANHFSQKITAAAVFKSSEPSQDGSAPNVNYCYQGKVMKVAVKRDTGRVIGFSVG